MDTLRYALWVILGAALLGACQAEPATQTAAAKAVAPVSAPSPGNSAKRKARDYYQLTANYDGVRLDVRVNDMPVIMNEEENGAGIHVVNDLLTGSENIITVMAKPPQGKAQPLGNAAIHVDVTAFPGQGGGDGKGKVLYSYDWKMKDAQLPLPSVRGQFQTTPLSEPLSWQNATKLSLATLDKAGINAQTKRLYEALKTKNAAETTALLTSEAHDQEVGFGLPLGDPAGDQRKIYEEQFRWPNWGLSPINYEALEYALYGGGRVVRVHAPNGHPAFTSTPDKDGGTTTFDVYLSLINGHWVIVK
ncbi:hypothetical protein [Hymenobacter psoromatis]|uniref:hypothetical protein n=1 Tax=Hymenobacter psoromatis TaxID=1484116 RepID=UPI001CC122CC|nr:hypothetical protein [Hymenobacter psoromatis]